MKKYGGMNIPHSDEFFGPILDRDGGRFDDGALIKALEVWPGRRTAVDIGAHVGTWTKVMAEHFDSVVAIEPVWENFECLQFCHSRRINVITAVHGECHREAGSRLLVSHWIILSSKRLT